MEEDKKKKVFAELLLRLGKHIVKGNQDHKRLMAMARANGLLASDVASEMFDDICVEMGKGGRLSPENLSFLIEVFPENENAAAYKDICKTRDILRGDVSTSGATLESKGDVSTSGATLESKVLGDGSAARKSHYPRKENQRGYMVILNFTEKRPGSYMDVTKMSEFFKEIAWLVEEKQDLNYVELQEYLRGLQKSFADKRFAEQYYAFCLVLMSHGDENGIKTDDGKSYPLDDVVKFFKNDRMPTFAGKPKMFLIQACRGSEEQGSVNLPDDDDKVNISDYVGTLSIPVDSDILIAYATTPGYKSYRRTSDYIGSWFLNEVLEVFQAEYCKEHVEEMLITVKENVAYNPKYVTHNKQSRRTDGIRQMPCSWSTFTRRLYLS